MVANESDVSASAPTEPPRRSKTKRFWNWKLIGIEFLMAVAGVGAFFVLGGRPSRLTGLGLGILGVWLLTREIRGLAINSQMISLQTGRPRRLPILALGRRVRINPASLQELTVTKSWYSFQVVQIQGGFGSELLVFQSRGQRLRFMRIVEELCPDVEMFRRASPAKQIS